MQSWRDIKEAIETIPQDELDNPAIIFETDQDEFFYVEGLGIGGSERATSNGVALVMSASEALPDDDEED
jgi:hypothetical protein